MLPMHLQHTCAAAAAAHAAWAASDGGARARLLAALADALETDRAALVALAHEETHLGAARLNGELDRTCLQLRVFASCSTGGTLFSMEAPPAAAGPRIARIRVPLGPVAMFAASNFPLAFSVLGGDTASALAAGCSVVIKAHPLHPRLSRRVHALAARVARDQGAPDGLLGLVEGAVAEGEALVRSPHIAAVAFTGSVRAGLALERLCRERTPPIPFFGELGATNPVVVLPAALAGDMPALAAQLAGSITQGAGQFCTSPGLLLVHAGPGADQFLGALARALAALPPLHPFLGPGIALAYAAGVATWGATPGVQVLPGCDGAEGRACLAQTDAATFIATPRLHEEVFGAALLAVRCASDAELLAALRAVPGSLTATVWGAQEETPLARAVTASAIARAGRVLFEGVPTGVAVVATQHHGGPWPASTRPETTSVGLRAADRFVRPVALQDAPAWLLAREGRVAAPATGPHGVENATARCPGI